MGWERRLEVSAAVSFALAMFSHIGDGPPYNTALALLATLAHHTRRGRHLFLLLVLLTLSFIPDVVWFASLDLHDVWNYIPLALLPCNAVVKLIALVATFHIFRAGGGTWSLVESHVPVEGDGMRTPSGSEGGGRSFSEAADAAGFPGRGASGSGYYSPAVLPVVDKS